MGVLSGTVGAKIYYVEGYNPLGVEREEWMVKLRRGIFRGIDREKGEKEGFGFVEAQDIFSENFEADNIFQDQYIYFSFRKDILKMQKKVLNRFLKEIEKKYKGQNISKKELKELKKEAERDYANRLYPTIYSWEVVWNLESGVLYFFNQSKSVNEKFIEYFESSLDLELVEKETATFASKILEPNDFEIFEKEGPSKLIKLT